MPNAAAFLDEPPKASDFLDTAPAPVASQFLDQPTVQEQAQKMASDPNFDTYQHAAQNPADFEAAFQAQRLRDNRPFLQKVGAGLSTLAQPATYTGAAKGVKNFVTGALQVPWDAVAHTYYSMTGDPRALTKQAEATLAGQNVEQSVRHTIDATAGNLGNSSAKYPAGLYDSGEIPADVSDEQQKQNAEDIDRRAFQDKVEAAKRSQQLAQGRPLDSGFVAGIYGAGGQVPSQEVSPEALQNAGSPAVDQAAIERSAAIADPNNILLGMAPELPGAGYVGGRLTQGAGKALQIPGRAVSAGVDALKAGAEKLEGLPGGRYIPHAVGVGALYHSAPAVGTAAAIGAGAKGLQWLGKGLEEQGGAAATGLPSALDATAANARVVGENAFGTNAQRTIGNAATRGAQTAIGMAPVNAAISEGDPEQFARSEVGAAAFGGAMDALASHRPVLVEAARPALRQKGLEGLDLNSTEGRASANYIQTLPADQQNTVLELNGALGGLPVQTTSGETVPARMIVLPSDQFQAQMKQLGIQNGPKSAAGFFWDGNGTAYINGESSSFNNDPGQVAGHEFGGHAAMNMLEAAGAKGGPIYDGLLSSAKQELYNPDGTPTPDFQKFVDAYNKKFDPTGQTKALDPTNQNAVEEFLAETAGRIISQKGAGEIAVPNNILDHITDGVGRFMANFSGVNPDAIGTGGHFDRTEVSKLSKEVRDSLLQLSGTKLRPQAGEGAISSPQTPEQYVQELQETLAKPRPTDTAANVKAWVKEQAQARKDLADFQGSPQSSFPASGKPPVAPSAPVAPPNMAKADAVKAVQQLGVKAAEAAQLVETAATALGGTPNASDLLTAAMKIKGGGKVQPSQPVPSNVQPAPQTATQPVSESPVVATQGPVVATAEAPKVQDAPPAPLAGGEVDAAKIASDAEQEAIAKERNPAIKAAQTRIKAAKIDALASAADQSGLHKETDEFGNTKIVGNFDPQNPIHQELAKIGGLTPEAAYKLQQIQALQGKPVYLRYRSAKSDTEGAGGEGTAKGVGDMNVRQEEYAKDPAAQRTEGTIQQKVVIPLNTEMSTKSGALQANYFTLDNVLHNAASIFERMKSAGIENPYGDTAKKQEPQLIADAQAVPLNHANGWKGDGSAPMKVFPDSNLPKLNPDYQPTVIPKERFDVLNMMMHNESASKIGELTKRLDDYKASGKEVPKSVAASYKRAQEAYALAEENSQWIDPVSGDTNALRAKLKASGFDTNKSFKSPFETLSPQHILDVSENPIAPQEGDIPTVRPTGFDIDPAELAKNGIPNQKAVAAGFSPDAQFSPESGKPAEGNTPAERLAREAEQAGVVMKADEIIGLMRNDNNVMSAIRAKIQKRTGKPAEFSPSGAEDSSPSSRRFAPLASILAQQRKEKAQK